MILFFDTETTGLPKNWKAPVTDLDNWPRLVQLAYLVYDFEGNLIHSCNEIVKPNGFAIPLDSSNIHGITTEKAIQRGSVISDVFELFNIHLKRAQVIVAHNMAYDEKIIGSELIRSGLENLIDEKEKICTMESTVELCKIDGPYGFKWPKLEELHRFLFKHDFEGAHDAMADIQATAKCFWELKRSGIIKNIGTKKSSYLKIPKSLLEKLNEATNNTNIYKLKREKENNEKVLFSVNNKISFDEAINVGYFQFKESIIVVNRDKCSKFNFFSGKIEWELVCAFGIKSYCVDKEELSIFSIYGLVGIYNLNSGEKNKSINLMPFCMKQNWKIGDFNFFDGQRFYISKEIDFQVKSIFCLNFWPREFVWESTENEGIIDMKKVGSILVTSISSGINPIIRAYNINNGDKVWEISFESFDSPSSDIGNLHLLIIFAEVRIHKDLLVTFAGNKLFIIENIKGNLKKEFAFDDWINYVSEISNGEVLVSLYNGSILLVNLTKESYGLLVELEIKIKSIENLNNDFIVLVNEHEEIFLINKNNSLVLGTNKKIRVKKMSVSNNHLMVIQNNGVEERLMIFKKIDSIIEHDFTSRNELMEFKLNY